MDVACPQDYLSDELFVPEALLDAGSETWNTLCEVVAHRMDDLADGQVLEIVSAEPNVAGDLQRWCRRTGNRLAGTLRMGNSWRIWVRKASLVGEVDGVQP